MSNPSIEIEALPPADFPRLKSVADGFTPDPRNSVVLVAKSEGNIVGRIMLLAPAHVEAWWVKEPWRSGKVADELVQRIELEARSQGISKLFAYAVDETMSRRIEKLGYMKLPWAIHAKELTCR